MGEKEREMTSFKQKLIENGISPLRAKGIDILQVNLGYRCNMSCKHCHIQAGPSREEMMERETVEIVLRVLTDNDIKTLDITGGAPELNPHFRYLVKAARDAERHVIVRSNLTIFFEEGMDDLPEFYTSQKVEVIASLPYYIEDNVDRVRGGGTFQKSIEALKRLNELGYGRDNGLPLNLVFNPQGAFLPPAQDCLEKDYKRELAQLYGVEFNKLYVFTNMPIGRFRDFLLRSRNFEKYIERLISAFNPATVDGIMCRYLISVGWDGRLYDCDFNQVIGLGIVEGYPQHIKDFDLSSLSEREIAVDVHCFGCTAGQGST